jgi:hypothetical protein
MMMVDGRWWMADGVDGGKDKFQVLSQL